MDHAKNDFLSILMSTYAASRLLIKKLKPAHLYRWNPNIHYCVHKSLSWARWIYPAPPHLIYQRFILIL